MASPDGLGQATVDAHVAWIAERAQTREAASEPSLRLRTVTEVAHAETVRSGARPLVVESGVDRQGRPSGPRFGTLVHALLEQPLRASDAELNALAQVWSRELGATSTEVDAALLAVAVARAHPLMTAAREALGRGECEHELPMAVRRENGELIEGVIDLVFRERTDAGTRLLLVDFKTDVELVDLDGYAQQLDLYADAYARAAGERPECVIFRV